MSKQTEVTFKIDTKILKMFQKQLVQMNKDLEPEQQPFEIWLEHEFNENGLVLLEMLLSDY